jgi:hypothetical protein
LFILGSMRYLYGFLEWLIYVLVIAISPKWRRLLRDKKYWWQEAGYKHPPAWSKYDGTKDRY